MSAKHAGSQGPDGGRRDLCRVPDKELAARCLAGDESAWSALYHRHGPWAYNLGLRMGLDAYYAEEVVSRTFLAVLQGLDRYRGGDFRGWLRSIALNAARDIHRARRREGEPRGGPVGVEPEPTGEPDPEPMQDWEDELETRERIRIVLQLLARMDGRCQSLIRLILIEGGTYREAADALGMPLGAVGPTLRRCLDKLRGLGEGAGRRPGSDSNG